MARPSHLAAADMVAEVLTGTLVGIDAVPVRVEVDTTKGMPAFNLVGLASGAVRESKLRVMAAQRNAGFKVPPRKITVSLAPADLRKDGAAFDLPIALAMLTGTGMLAREALDDYLVAGELSLEGEVRRIRGALSLAVAARRRGKEAIMLPASNAKEAAVVPGIRVVPVRHLSHAVAVLRGDAAADDAEPGPALETEVAVEGLDPDADLAEVVGQTAAKRALLIAAAGGHNLLLAGPPGSGKSMLARRLPALLPEMSEAEAIETTQVYSAVGLLPEGVSLMRQRPFRAPHHSISDAGLVGGGSVPRPGELSLAHHGILFLDELPEFRRSVLEVLRQPLEDGRVTIARARQVVTFPATPLLVGAMNPCPCGYAGSPERACVCAPGDIHRYRHRLSGPLLDRIDLHVFVSALRYSELAAGRGSLSTAEARARVVAARARQQHRFAADAQTHTNAHMPARELTRHCALDEEAAGLLRSAMERFGLSARAHARILRVARTIADLEDEARLAPAHVAEAIGYRQLDREL